jgi:putative sterol carrier protein
MGMDFKEAFSYIELLEEQAKVNLFIQGLSKPISMRHEGSVPPGTSDAEKQLTYQLFSDAHISRLVELVNNDEKTERLGSKFRLAFSLALKNKDTGKTVCFYYSKGKIIKTDSSQDADFLFVDREAVLKKIFNSEIDPLVASIQRKITTEGDVGKMIQWYPLLVRQFKLWTEAPVE